MENPEKSAMIVMHCSPGHSAEVRSDSLSMSFCRPMVLTSFVRCLQRKKTSGVPSRAKPRKCMRLVLMKGQRSCAVIGSSLLRKVSSTLTMSMAASTSCFLAIRKRASCTSDLPGYLFFIIVSFPASTFCRMLFAGDDCCSSMIGECAGRERQGHPHGACPVGMRGGDEVPPDEVQEQQQHPVRDLLAGHQGVPFEILCAGVCHCDALQGVLELVARVLDRRKRPRVMPSRLPLGLDKAHEAVGHPDPQVAAPLEGADHAVAPRRHHAHDHVAGRRVCCGSLHLRGDGGHAQDVDPNLRVPATVRLFSTGARRALVERRDHLPEGCLPGLLGTLVVRAQDDLRGAPAHVEHKRPILCQGAWKRRPILHLLDVAESQLRVMVAKEFTPTT
mmetsp:Transcript_34748/g.82426  ORF Transcript_34748/g.82426 Transcript_34748/m.82426 type:complete len:389 (+) Transcript_34748:606-1772(+)